MSDKWIVGSMDEAARFFLVHRRTIREWKNSGCPGSKGAWDLSAMTKWRIQRAASRGGVAPAGGNGDGITRADAEIKLLRERCRKLELANQAVEGDLVSARDSEQAWLMGLARIRSRLESLPDELEGCLPEETRQLARADIDQFVRQLLQEMASWDPIEV